MNTIKLFFLLTLYFPVFAFAQKSDSSKMIIEYDYILPPKTNEQLEERMNKIKEILPEGEMRENLINDMIKDNKATHQNTKLICQNSKASYTNETALSQPFKIGEVIDYWDLENNDFVAQAYIMNKPFIVIKDSVQLNWTYSTEEKQIGAFKAKKAIAKKDTTFFAEVWYTDDLPAFPIEDLFGIKGGIVEATFEDGKQLKLKTFTTTTTKKDALKKPSAGKKISDKDFQLLQEKKIKEANQDAKNKFKN